MHAEHRSGVYFIECLSTKKVYIGQSGVDIKKRLARHRTELRARTHVNSHLQRAWNKYGEADFFFGVILYCPPVEAVRFERAYLEGLERKEKFNQMGGGEGAPMPAHIRIKISRANMGHEVSPATRERLRIARKGLRFPPEFRLKVSKALKGKSKTPQAIEAARQGWLRSRATQRAAPS